MNLSCVPYDDIFPTQVHSSRFASEDELYHGFRDRGFGLDAVSRVQATDLWLYVRPFI